MTYSSPSPAALGSSRASAAAIERSLANSETAEDALLIIKYMGDAFEPRNVLTAFRILTLLTRASEIPRGRLHQQRELGVLLDMTSHAIDEFRPAHLAHALRSIAILGLSPGERLLQRFYAAISGALPDFKPSSARSLLWASAKLGHRPGAKALHSLSRTAASNQKGLNPRQLSILLWSFATLSYHPGTTTLARVMANAAMEARDHDPRPLSRILWALARLGHHPGNRVLNHLARRFLSDPAVIAPGQLSTALWSLAVLAAFGGAPDISLLREFADLVDRHREELDQEDARRVFQAHLLLEMRPGGSPLAACEELLRMAKGIWLSNVAEATQYRRPSSLESKVATSLDRLGERYQSEHLTEDGCFSIDFGITDPEGGIALEVDGPTHQMATVAGNQAPNGPTLARNTLLAARGWRVVVVTDKEMERVGANLDALIAAKLRVARNQRVAVSPLAWLGQRLREWCRALGALTQVRWQKTSQAIPTGS